MLKILFIIMAIIMAIYCIPKAIEIIRIRKRLKALIELEYKPWEKTEE